MISVTVKGSWFNPEVCLGATKRAARRVYGKQGAYLRAIAQRSIKRAKPAETSDPGHQPYTHGGKIKRAIVFAADPDSVVIGPTQTGIGMIGHTHEFGGDEPAVAARATHLPVNWKIEIGGHGPIRYKNPGATGADAALAFAKLTTQAMVDASAQIAMDWPWGYWIVRHEKPARKYPARPFMAPALGVAKSHLPGFWADAVRPVA